MRKILISILLILLIVLAFFTIFQGISIGSFQILSATGIVELNDNLNASINEANTKIKQDLQNKKTELSENVQLLLQSKEDYYDLANVSTENEINEASTEEVYTTEYLWLRVGRHARNEGVNIRMEILTGDAGDSSVKNIDFTVDGAYVAIMDFISAIEDDSELAFRIENFNMLPSGDNLQATFSVTEIRIRQEQTTATVNNTTSTTDTMADPATNAGGTTDTSAQS